MRASNQAGQLLLELSDDGHGVDLEQVRRSIVERQLSPAETAAQLSEEELLTFLFLPGFSLRDTVTEVSGRGVGLDAVQHMVRQLRGAVVLEQKAGEGSRFQLEVPLTLSVVRSLVVEVGGEAYAFPLAHIERMCDLAIGRHRPGGRSSAFLARRSTRWPRRGQPVAQPPASQNSPATLKVVVIRDRDTVYGVVVERFLGERTLVVQPLDPRLGKVRTSPPAPCSTTARRC